MRIETSQKFLSPNQIQHAQGVFAEALAAFDGFQPVVARERQEPNHLVVDTTSERSWPAPLPGALAAAVDKEAFPASTELQDADTQTTDTKSVPRPSFELFSTLATQKGCPANRQGELAIWPEHSALLMPGLRGFATFVLRSPIGEKRTITGPAIVLPEKTTEGSTQVAVLIAEAQPDGRSGPRRIFDDQHALLDAEYIKQLSQLKAEHGSGDVTDVREIGTSLMIASSVDAGTIHGESHTIARGNFGQNFANSGRQDISLGHAVRAPRVSVMAADRLVFETALHVQLPPAYSPLGVNLSPAELSVGMTLAATDSKVTAGIMPRPDLLANMGEILNV